MSYIDRERVLQEIFASVLFGNVRTVSTVSIEKKQVNLLLLGKTGHGKSSTGNSTLGRREFRSSSSASSVTSEVQCSQGECKGVVINIIDTPGLADTTFTNCKAEEMNQVIDNMTKALRMSPGGIHAFLFVVAFGNRFTEEDRSCLDALRQIFGPTFLERNGIVVFTHGDLFLQSMEEEETPNKSFDEWCKEQRGALGDLIKECAYRCLLFDNLQRDSAAKQHQQEKLVEQVGVFERSYTLSHFQMHCDRRKELIIKLKLPKLKNQFQSEIDNLNSDINLLARFEQADFSVVEEKLETLEHKLAFEDGGTGLLNEIQVQLTRTRLIICTYRQRQIERTRQSNTGSCSIL